MKSIVRFKRINLLKETAGLGKFDLVLCRNVAIYFSEEFRKTLFRNLALLMDDNAYLFLGSSENMFPDPAVFRKKINENYIYFRKAALKGSVL